MPPESDSTHPICRTLPDAPRSVSVEAVAGSTLGAPWPHQPGAGSNAVKGCGTVGLGLRKASRFLRDFCYGRLTNFFFANSFLDETMRLS